MAFLWRGSIRGGLVISDTRGRGCGYDGGGWSGSGRRGRLRVADRSGSGGARGCDGRCRVRAVRNCSLLGNGGGCRYMVWGRRGGGGRGGIAEKVV